MKYFTSDTHINHTSILELQQRPFLTLSEMDNKIIENICNTVTPNDELYFIGDVIMGENIEYGLNLLRKIKCHKFLIKGNHDKKKERYEDVFEDITKYMEIKDKEYNVVLCMSHYPFLCWHHQRKGSIMLHGHIHSDKSYNIVNEKLKIKRYDVGVDANDYKPVSLEEIVNFFRYVDRPCLKDMCVNEYVKNNQIFCLTNMAKEEQEECYKEFKNNHNYEL